MLGPCLLRAALQAAGEPSVAAGLRLRPGRVGDGGRYPQEPARLRVELAYVTPRSGIQTLLLRYLQSPSQKVKSSRITTHQAPHWYEYLSRRRSHRILARHRSSVAAVSGYVRARMGVGSRGVYRRWGGAVSRFLQEGSRSAWETKHTHSKVLKGHGEQSASEGRGRGPQAAQVYCCRHRQHIRWHRPSHRAAMRERRRRLWCGA